VLQSVSKKLGDNFHNAVDEGDGSEVTQCHRDVYFGYQGYKGVVNGLKVYHPTEKIHTDIIYIIFNNVPALIDK
jgi:hypothetical protein